MTHDGDPDDTTLIAALDSQRTDAWRALLQLDEDFRERPHADDDCVWAAQYPRYGARVELACRVLADLGAVTPAYDWMHRKPPSLAGDGTVSAADAIRLATTVVRSERFGDGNIGAALESGVLQAAISALASWYREQAR